MSSFIPYGKQNISDSDIEAVIQVLRSDFITQGPVIERFEKAVADYCGVKYAVAVSSATAGLHLSCLALDLNNGDRLWTSPNTFVASANCGRYCGAYVDFVDINPLTYNLSIEALEIKLKQAEYSRKLPKVLIPVHFAGQSCEMDAIFRLAKYYNFKIIEDASHAIGAKYQGKLVGCCEFSDMAVFSFHPVKIITTGEGGMVLTNHEDLYEKLTQLRAHGITRNPKLMTEVSHGSWYYQQLELGLNYRLTDIQAALGESQMQRLNTFIKQRQLLAERYDRLLEDLPLNRPFQHPDTLSSWHLYVIRLKLEQINKSHRMVFDALRDAQIGVNLHYIPVHTQPYYQKLGFSWGNFPKAEQYYREAISLPMYFDLTESNQNRVVDALTEALTNQH